MEVNRPSTKQLLNKFLEKLKQFSGRGSKMDCLLKKKCNWQHPKTLTRLSNIHERKIRESLEINNIETKAEYHKSIKVLNRDQGNIVNEFMEALVS